MDNTSSAPFSPFSQPAPGSTLRPSRLRDEALARLSGRGSEQAFAALYRRYHQPLYRYCRSIVHDDADAQDALQSTFTNALTALHRGQRKAPVRPWLFRIAHNEAISVLRQRHRFADETSGAPAQLASSAEDHAAARWRVRQLWSDLAELPVRARGALVMRELSGLSHEEIAVALQTSVGAARQAIFDARRALSEFAEGRDMACEEVCGQISDGDRRSLRSRRVRAHLRDCSSCSAFAAAIPSRSADLRALVPTLPSVASAALLTRVTSGISTNGASGGAPATGPTVTGAVGKVAGSAIASKAMVGAAALVVAGAGVGGVTATVRLLGGGSGVHPGHAFAGSINARRRDGGVASQAYARHEGRGSINGSARFGQHGSPAGGSPSSGRALRVVHHGLGTSAGTVGPLAPRFAGSQRARRATPTPSRSNSARGGGQHGSPTRKSGASGRPHGDNGASVKSDPGQGLGKGAVQGGGHDAVPPGKASK